MYKMDIIAAITEDGLRVDFFYSADTFSDETIAGVVEKVSATARQSLAELRLRARTTSR
jgi:hypothetical protein